ncbi:hypothetical protein FIBSPDRAFT_740631 [Athelia psychrophila]|uniref:Uncharacterized protein n=1 Tax=Athelia psychrophila TaxID=1759441 RepID=A0A166K256_9AGAM|nr:hypothetical protein FIBSPDRAFT_740631 [Fibularhizoctonia sp. CBS 109695]
MEEPTSNEVVDDIISPPHPPEPFPITVTPSGRPARQRRAFRHPNDLFPEAPAPLPLVAPGSSVVLRSVILHVSDTIRTGYNRFGLLREYKHRPSYDPDSAVHEDDLSEPHTTPQPPLIKESTRPPPWPFQNMSIYLMMEWMITGSSRKSIGEVDRLAKTVLTHADFRLSDLAGFSAKRENKVLDASEGNQPLNPADGDGWLQSNVSICIPTGVVDPNGSGKLFLVPGLWHRPLLPVMKAALADASARWFHFSPFKRLWKSPSGTEHRVFDEAYTSDAWIEAHDKLQKQPNEPGCQLEKVVLGLMLSSDATHLTNFGTAKLWPVYLYFANLSKYIRWDRNSGAAHHIAYLPSVSLPLNANISFN